MEDICTRLGAARPLETEARDGSHRRLGGGQDLLKPILGRDRVAVNISLPIIPESTELAKVFHDHDVGLGEFALSEK